MFIGGEFYYEDRWLTNKLTLTTEGMYYLNGGQACLIVISDFLLDHKISSVLLPSYLCPSIVNIFERQGLAFDFYQVRKDFSIDLEDLKNKLTTNQAVYLINYFGFPHSAATRYFISDLQQKGKIVVEDNAQAGFLLATTGDFVFNSMRKLVPYDGGYLITRFNMHPYIQQYINRPNNRLRLIREYREKLHPYLENGKGNYDHLVRLFTLSEQLYATDLVVLGDEVEKDHIEYLDWVGIKQARRQNYQYMSQLVKDIPEITPIFPTLLDGMMPMGFPIYFTGVSRDRVNNELGNSEIGLSIHWDDLITDQRTNRNTTAVEMASNIITLTIDQRVTSIQMDYLARTLRYSIASVKEKPSF
jgi:dTDP-4-amino-4,6-dideoxygalactose transaminase